MLMTWLGGATFASSFGPDSYTAYVCVDFKGDGYSFSGPTESGAVPSASNPLGALLTFPTNPGAGTTSILARVGVSLISTNQACSNAELELPNWNFDDIRQANWQQWNELLGRVRVDTTNVDHEIVVLFYSSVCLQYILSQVSQLILCLVVQDTYCSR
jgi:putative alpha-1,2-mannosidase